MVEREAVGRVITVAGLQAMSVARCPVGRGELRRRTHGVGHSLMVGVTKGQVGFISS